MRRNGYKNGCFGNFSKIYGERAGSDMVSVFSGVFVFSGKKKVQKDFICLCAGDFTGVVF